MKFNQIESKWLKNKESLCVLDYLITWQLSELVHRIFHDRAHHKILLFKWVNNFKLYLSEKSNWERKNAISIELGSRAFASIPATRSCRLSNAIGHGLLLPARRLCKCWPTTHRKCNSWSIIVCVPTDRQRFGKNTFRNLCELLSSGRTLFAIDKSKRCTDQQFVE